MFSALLILESCENNSKPKLPAVKKSIEYSENPSEYEIHEVMAEHDSSGTKENVVIYYDENYTEKFWSNKIGVNDSFRIELEQIRTFNDIYVDTEFFKKQNGKWILVQKIKESKDGVSDLGAEVTDINGDGFNDLLFQTATAARGANVVKTLFLFDTVNSKLIKIKNSSYYPNLMYNSQLKCIDAQYFCAGSTTAFLKIVADTFQEFADVSAMNGYITISLINEKGKRREISNKKYAQYQFGDYNRFISYHPLKIRQME